MPAFEISDLSLWAEIILSERRQGTQAWQLKVFYFLQNIMSDEEYEYEDYEEG